MLLEEWAGSLRAADCRVVVEVAAEVARSVLVGMCSCDLDTSES